MAKFKVIETFKIETKNMLVLAGHIVSDTIDSEMSLISENYNIKIKSVEMIDSAKSDVLVGLTFIYSNEFELSKLELLKDTTVLVS